VILCSSGNYWKLGQASRHVEFFDVGVVSWNVKRFNDYYFQVEVNFCVNRHLILRIVLFVRVDGTNSFVIVIHIIRWRQIINWRGAAKILRQDSNNVLQLVRGVQCAHKSLILVRANRTSILFYYVVWLFTQCVVFRTMESDGEYLGSKTIKAISAHVGRTRQ
jgi:hypothetical protein